MPKSPSPKRPAKRSKARKAPKTASARNEVTSADVARIASKVLHGLAAVRARESIGVTCVGQWWSLGHGATAVTAKELRSLAASCLTQRPARSRSAGTSKKGKR